jgi:DNA processing protein
MFQLNFLLYILSQSINSIKPTLIEGLVNWYELYFINPEQQLDVEELLSCLYINQEQKQKFLKLYTPSELEKFSKEISENNIQITNLFEESYPKQLTQIPDRPLLLYYQGDLSILQKINLAMVGSRAATTYGRNVVEKILSGLNGYDFNIISGLAFGIDAASHIQALKNNLATTAVLGSGIHADNMYPKNNFRLAQNILEAGGLIISEYPPNFTARKHQFIARNRIIAGLSSAVAIIEAAQKSGSLLTADFAAEYNRNVFAVPGSIFSANSTGCHHLIFQGANILTSAKNILEEFNIAEKTMLQESKFTGLTLRVLECIQIEDKSLEEIAEQTDIPIADLISIISELELAQKIKLTSTQSYTIF